MNWRVTRRTLLFTAGMLWLVAGANVFWIGAVAWSGDVHYWLFKLAVAAIVFCLFFGLVFRRLYRKHSARIQQGPEKSCPFSFFDLKGWVVMAGMIGLGVLVRKLHLLPESFIAVFYTGLSSALILTGGLFLRQGFRIRQAHAEPKAASNGLNS